MNSLKIFYVTNGSQQEANALATELLQKRLIGCANIVPIQSFYWWDGAITDDAEFVVIAKTVPELAKKVELALQKIHPYETPCILQFEGRCNQEYYRWLCSQLQR